MAKTVVVSTIAYERRYGRKPRGYGLWYFRLPGGFTFSYSGGYGAAVRAATAVAGQFRHAYEDTIHLYG